MLLRKARVGERERNKQLASDVKNRDDERRQQTQVLALQQHEDDKQ